MKTRRLFFAVWPPEEVRERLWDSLAPLRDATTGVRWIPPRRYHVTLRFMGDVAAALFPRLVRAAEALSPEPAFRACLTGNGTFPRRGVPRVYWVGLQADPLVRMRNLLDRALAQEGIAAERRVFKPHLTVGRTMRGGTPGGAGGADPVRVSCPPEPNGSTSMPSTSFRARCSPTGPGTPTFTG